MHSSCPFVYSLCSTFELFIFFFINYTQGVFLWEKGGEAKEKAAEHFIQSAKLNPKNGISFKYLGHYYASVSLDTQRAIRCYQRAVVLNPDDSESGVSFVFNCLFHLKGTIITLTLWKNEVDFAFIHLTLTLIFIFSHQEALCNLLDQGGKDSLEVVVCREASEMSPRAFWAFRRLGFLQVFLSISSHFLEFIYSESQFRLFCISHSYSVDSRNNCILQIFPIKADQTI